ncbi:MAG: hypothetical protein U0T80_01470 [Flavobacteriaceae bacterium]
MSECGIAINNFLGANGTAPYTFTYTDPSGATQTKLHDFRK